MSDAIPESSDDPRVPLKAYWGRLVEGDKRIHAKLVNRFPAAVRVLDWTVGFLFDLCVAPAFAIIVSFLLVPLVISGAISLITWLSVVAAWLIAVLWVAKRAWISSLTIVSRGIVVFVCAVLMAYIGRSYIRWTLVAYAKNQPKTSEVAQQSDPNALAIQGLKDAFEQALGGRKRNQPKAQQTTKTEVPAGSFADYTNDHLIDDAKSTIKDVRSLAGIWNWHLRTMEMTTHDSIMFAKPRTATSCPSLTSPGCDTAMDPKDVPAYTKKREQEKLEANSDARKKATGSMMRLCRLRTEIVTNRLETWNLSTANGPIDDLCAHLTTVDYTPDDMYKAITDLEQLSKELAAPTPH